MEFAGAAFPITPLLSTCTKIVTILHNVGKKFKRAPLMMTSIATECSLIHVALAQLRSFDWGTVSAHGDGRQEQMTRATESVILGCTLTLSVIEEYAIELQEYVDGSPLSPTEQMGIMARVRVLWKEDEMRELLLQMRGYQTGLTNLIRAAHDSDFGDTQDPLNSQGSNFSTLLQRSRSSRVRKPLSIRAAMAQAATYSNMSRSIPSSHSTSNQSTSNQSTGNPSTSNQSTGNPSTSNQSASNHSASNHSVHPFTSTVQATVASHTFTAPAASPRNSSIQSMSPIAADLYDSATSATASKKIYSDNARRKRPAYLALHGEPSETLVDGRHVHTRRDKDQLRKSSPTVGDQFTFVPGEPPPEDAPPQPKVSYKDPKKETSLVQEVHPSEPLHYEPPNGPLPKPPSRSPSRSRSPSKVTSKPPSRPSSRPPSRAELPKSAYAERVTPASSPSKPSSVEEQIDKSSTKFEEDNQKSRPPSPQQEEPEEATSTPPTPIVEPAAQPRKQKSSSSVRSQIIALPETARLRKQASGEMMLRKQPSAEMLAVRRADAMVPALPIPMNNHISNGHVRGNAFGKTTPFGKQGSHASLQMNMQNAPPRTSSLEGLSERSRKRSATDLAPSHNIPDPTPLPLRPKRSISRSASDAHRPPNLKIRRNQQTPNVQEDHHSPTAASLLSPTSQPPTSADSESWPLTPDAGHTLDHTYPRRMSVERNDHHEQAHSRSVSGNSFQTSRLLSPDHTPRASRASTPRSGTPRTRSRSNTLQTIASEVAERDPVDDSISVSGSVAPSVMSAQWFRPPRERLGLGTRVSRAEILPWELGAPEDEGPPVPPKPKTPPKSKKFSMFPSRAPSRMKEEFNPDSPPRSPLLTETFLRDVKDSLPESPRRGSGPDHQSRPSTSMKNRDGATTPDWSRKKPKKEKKKESRFPTLSEIVSEYKGMTNTWYASAYAEEAREQKLEREAKRPATGNTSLSSGSKPNGRGSMEIQTISSKSQSAIPPRPSRDMSGSMTSSSGSSRDKERNKQKKGSSTFPSVKEMWSEYRSVSNQWYTAGYKQDPTRDIASPQSGFS